MKPDKFILDEHGEPQPAADLMEWATWFETSGNKRKVASDHIGDSHISTVFLALDHSFSEPGPPILWETMVFGGPLSDATDRCSGSREQAEAMHAQMVERVKEKLRP